MTPENRRAVRHATLHLSRSPAEVFPFLCPVREYEWIPTWRCRLPHSTSGVAELGCVFVTDFPDRGPESWLTVEYAPGRAIEFVRNGAGHVGRLRFELTEPEPGRAVAEVTESLTALDTTGERRLAALAPAAFADRMARLERLLEHRLVTGTMLRGPDDPSPAPAPRPEGRRRVRFDHELRLVRPPSVVFPLLCPVREREWIEPWRATVVHSLSGLAERDAVFVTDFPDPGGPETWLVLGHEPDRAIEFVRANRLKVVRYGGELLSAPGGGTRLLVHEETTALDDEGDRAVAELGADAFAAEMGLLGRMLNHFLETGAMLRGVA